MLQNQYVALLLKKVPHIDLSFGITWKAIATRLSFSQYYLGDLVL